MTIKAVLFDFSGTLFRAEPTESWLRAVLKDADLTLPERELTEAAGALETVGAMPGSGVAPRLPKGSEELWRRRDESAEQHRAMYTAISRQVRLPDPRLHDALYDRHMLPAAWGPYPDAAEVLGTLRERGSRSGWSATSAGICGPSSVSTASARTWARTCCRTSTASRSRTRDCSRPPATRWASPPRTR